MLKLEDIKPLPGKFKLEITGKEYVLRPFNVEDEIWLRQTYGDKIAELFSETNLDTEALCRIAFHQLADKSDFKKVEVTSINEEGEEVEAFVGGYKLLMTKIQGMQEKIDILLAINETLGISRPKIKEIAGDADKKQKKKKVKKRTGPIS